MKLQFRILWIDDDRKDKTTMPKLNSQRTSMLSYLDSNYFLGKIDVENGDIDIDDSFPYNSEHYDLFIVDFNIGHKKGFEYIKRIRSNSSYTDIIFYSKNPIEKEIRDYLNKLKKDGTHENNFLQGVFLSDRDNLAIDFENLLDIIDRKVNNLYTMRGLVLAETADLDYILCEIIDKLCDAYTISKTSYPLQQNSSKVCPDDSTSEKFISWIQSDDGGNNSNIIYHLTKTSSWGLFAFTTLIHGNLVKYRKFYKDIRNNLAHSKTEITAAGKMKAGRVEYDIGDLKIIRKQLLEFRECFEDFRDNRI